jgi:SAM-dependent methyltransferase
VQAVHGDLGNANLAGQADAAFTAQNLHDIYNGPGGEAGAIAFAKSVYDALKPGGIFITSHLVPSSEFSWERINRRYFEFQALVWKALINPRWESFVKSRQSVIDQLAHVGFQDVKVIPDSQGIFPTFVAAKP